jgi:TonB family protein
MSFLTRLWNVFRESRLEQELDDELRFHLAQRVEAHLKQGSDRADAEAAALRQFGAVSSIRKQMKEIRMMNQRFVTGVLVGAIAVLIPMLVIRRQPPPQLPAPMGVFFPGRDGVKSPVLIREQKPVYTPDALKEKITGTVLLQCVVRTDGVCGDAAITRSLDPRLDQAAVSALQGWRFQPGTREGQPVATLVTVEMAFMLR